MMPGAADGVAHYQSFRERTVIVAADCSDGEKFVTDPHQQNVRVADMSDELVVLEGAQRNTLAEIGSVPRQRS